MKKLLLSTIVLLAFSVSIILFQLSCKKSADAASLITSSAVQQLNKIIYTINSNVVIPIPGSTVPYSITVVQIWSANYDGTNQQQINIALPTGVFIGNVSNVAENVLLSPGQKIIFFSVFDTKTFANSIYSSNIDGSNPKSVMHLIKTSAV